MTYQPQFFTAPDGSTLVVLAERDYQRLLADALCDDDARDVRAADRALAESDVRFPAAVVDGILAGMTPVAAWRAHRGLTQERLAQAAGVSQAGIARLEARKPGMARPIGRWETRQAIARALDVPVSALDPIGD